VVTDEGYYSGSRDLFKDRPNKRGYFRGQHHDHGTSYVGFCNRIFEVDDKNIILGWDLKGNDCAIYDGFSMANPRSSLVTNRNEK